MTCWCGRGDLARFDDDYDECPACGTLVRRGEFTGDLYGRRYWFEHQAELGQPDLEARAEGDLPERCAHWLRAVLPYRCPPGRALDVGCAHGGFVALLRQAGFDARGLEMDTWVADYAARTFGVPMLVGDLAEQELEPASQQLISAMDVLEHVPDPLALLRRCVALLAADGVLVLQTPSRPEGVGRAQLDADGDRFVDMLLPEHLHLLTRSGMVEMLRRAGLIEFAFEPALFAHYDMFLVAGRRPLQRRDATAVASALRATPSGRTVLALLQATEQRDRLRDDYEVADADRVGRMEIIERLDKELTDTRTRSVRRTSHPGALRADLDALRERYGTLRDLVVDHRTSRVYRGLVSLGLWKHFDRALLYALGERQSREIPADGVRTIEEREIAVAANGSPPGRAIGVDLWPLLPGGENGGAKLVAVDLVRTMARLAPEQEFVLLTSPACHEELGALDAPNVRRWALSADPATAVGELLAAPPLRLLFCPMTSPRVVDPRVPVVCLIHDLQYLSYPRFFGAHDRAERDRAFRRAAAWSERVVTVSRYVRQTVLDNSALREDQVVAIYNALADRVTEPSEADVDAALRRYDLRRGEFLLYPANFWEHKNHRMLLTALGQLRQWHPELRPTLVLTGADRPDPGAIREAARRMGLGDAVRFLGYVSDADLAALLTACRALVFPSLYEGFGIPVLEAMVRGRPVLCSNVTSLPEVAGDAGLLFDPRRPDEIAAAMARILADDALADELGRRGRRRAVEIGSLEDMARGYLEVLEQAASEREGYRDALAGVHADGWTAPRLAVSHAVPSGQLELQLSNPTDRPVKLSLGGDGRGQELALAARHGLRLLVELPAQPGCLEMTVSPPHRGSRGDDRELGVQLWACRLRGAGSEVDLLAERTT